jgi:hypothetical protein
LILKRAVPETICVALIKQISSENITSVLKLEAPPTEPEKRSSG